MKKKIFVCLLLMICALGFGACKKNNDNFAEHIIEERENFYYAEDALYCITFTSGMREQDYSIDGTKNEMVEFGIITFSNKANRAMANDTYRYRIVINDQELSGELTKSGNNYAADIAQKVNGDEDIAIQVEFSGYTFNQHLTNISNDFSISKDKAVEIASKELKDEIKQIASDNNNMYEVVVKIIGEYSSNHCYYWYVGIISPKDEMVGILIDTASGEVIAKKV